MKTAIILHGMPPKEEYFSSETEAQSSKHWLPWLQRQLILNGVLAQTIELPKPYAPEYGSWKAAFEQMRVSEETMLIGHSCGAGFLVRWLSENKVKVGKVALVAPFLDPEHTVQSDFFNFQIDATVPAHTEGVHIFFSTDDDKDISDSVATIRAAWPDAAYHEFSDHGHFTVEDMKTREFPELRDVLVG